MLLEKNEQWKKPNDISKCKHLKVFYKNECFGCSDCEEKEITVENYTDKYNEEKKKMNELGENDNLDVVDSINRGISIEFLIEFCKAFDLWDVSVAEINRDYIIPMTSDSRCRFVDLPILKTCPGVVGRSKSYIAYSEQSKFGDLVAAISNGADLNRHVAIWGFATRQWPCSKNDWFVEYSIQRCSSLIVFCPDPPELLQYSNFTELSASLMTSIPFFRMWCIYEIFFAAMSNGVSIVVKCGHHQRNSGMNTLSYKFIWSKSTLEALVEKVDANTAYVKHENDREFLSKKLEAMPTGSSDNDKMNARLRGVLRAAVATCGDSLLHNAACGDKSARRKVLSNLGKYIHQIAIAGYFQLLTEALVRKPDLLDAIDADNRRSLLINAAWGGSLKCVNHITEMGALRDKKDKNGNTALSYAKEFGFSDCVEYLSRPVPPTFYIKHVQSQRYVSPDHYFEKLVLHECDIVHHQLPVKENIFLFRFVDDVLQHVQKGTFVYRDHGRKDSGASIHLRNSERSHCYLLDYDSQHCLLAGEDNFFIKVDFNNELVWHKYKGTNDCNNPFRSENGFEFQIIFHPPLLDTRKSLDRSPPASVSAQDPAKKTTHLDYHSESENIIMSGKIHELMFPRHYLVDYVEERPPHNGKITNIPKGDLGYKTIANDSITQRMFLITANIRELHFSFAKNPWEWETGCDFGKFTQLISFKFNDIDSVSNSEVSDKKSTTLSIKLDENFLYFDFIKIQCVLSLQNNPSNVKHICYLEVKAKNATATVNEEKEPYKDGVWCIGTELSTSLTAIGNTKVHVFEVEKIEGPLVFTGVGIDNYAGFVFQLACMDSNSKLALKNLYTECFVKNELPRLIPADITNYEYFESLSRDHTGYPNPIEKQSLLVRRQKFLVRNTFRELAVEDAIIPIFFQQLNFFNSIDNTKSPSMIDMLEECFAKNKLGLLQSVIRISHIKTDDHSSSMNASVRQIWATFADTVLMVKHFKLERPNLNLIECAILSKSPWDKWEAVFVAVAQCLMASVLILHVLDPLTDAYAIVTNTVNKKEYSSTWYGFWMNLYWRVDFSFMMTIIAVVAVILKVKTQIDDQQKFRYVFDKLIASKNEKLDQFLLILDYAVNNLLPILLIIITFMLISRSDEVTDLVLNCLALTFIVELDDDLNKRDAVEIDDLVIDTFKEILSSNCKKINDRSSSFPVEKKKKFLQDRLISADYSTDSKSMKQNLEVLKVVRDCIDTTGRLLPVVNANFGGDPHYYGERKYLVLHFKGDVVINVQEHLVVDFLIIEKMLKTGVRGYHQSGHPQFSSSFHDSSLWNQVTEWVSQLLLWTLSFSFMVLCVYIIWTISAYLSVWFQLEGSWVLDLVVSKNGTRVDLTWNISANSDAVLFSVVDMESELKKLLFRSVSSPVVKEVLVEIHQAKKNNSWQTFKELGVLSASFNPDEQVRRKIGDALSSIGYYDVQIESTMDVITLHYPMNVSAVSNSDIALCAETIARKLPTSMIHKLSDDQVVPASRKSSCSSSGFYELSKWEYSSDAIKSVIIMEKKKKGSVSVQLSGLCLSAIPPDLILSPPNIITTVAGLTVTEIGYQESCSGSSGKISLLFERE